MLYDLYGNFSGKHAPFIFLLSASYPKVVLSKIINLELFTEINSFQHLKNKNNDYKYEKRKECWTLYSLSIRYRLSLFLKRIFGVI